MERTGTARTGIGGDENGNGDEDKNDEDGECEEKSDDQTEKDDGGGGWDRLWDAAKLG